MVHGEATAYLHIGRFPMRESAFSKSLSQIGTNKRTKDNVRNERAIEQR